MTAVRESILVKLRRANLQLALSTLMIAGFALTLVSFLTLRTYVNQNLTLVARSIAYSAEAAVVFRDMPSAQDTLSLIATQEGLWQAELRDTQGMVLAQYQSESDSGLEQVLSQFGALVFPHTAVAEVLHEGVKVGQVSLRGSFAVYAQFLLEVLVVLVLSVGVVVMMRRRFSRRFEADIVKPLDQLAALTRTARVKRAFDTRAPPAQVLEINALSDDFNALLAEIQGHEQELLRRQARLEVANQALSHQAFHDSLTGLPNRAHFFSRLTNAVEASGPGKAKLAVMYIDCDYFKHINDSLGHAAGDEVLIEFGRRMRAQLREGDALARLGGDEFGVMLTPLRSVEDAAQVAAKMAETLSEPIITQAAGPVQTSATIGVAVFPDHGATVDDVLRCADAVMYRAKRQQRGIYLVAEDCDVQASQEAVAQK